MSELKHTEKQLRETIVHEKIEDITFHYSLGKKQANTLSFLTNDRLLIFNEKQGTIFYINPPSSTPFKTIDKIPKPKTDIANVNLSIIKQVPQTSTLSIQYNKKTDKGEPVGAQWNFTLSAGGLAAAWIKMIQGYKSERLAKLLGVENNSKIGVIGDALAFGMMPQKKQEVISENQEEKNKSSFILQEEEKKKKQQAKKEEELRRIEEERKIQQKRRLEESKRKAEQRQLEEKRRLQEQKRKQEENKLQKSDIKKSYVKNQSQMKKSSLGYSKMGKSDVEEGQLYRSHTKPLTLQSKVEVNQNPYLQRSNINQSRLSNQRYSKKAESKVQSENYLNVNKTNIYSKQIEEEETDILKASVLPKQIQPKSTSDIKNDWNYKFILARKKKVQHEVMSEFTVAAMKMFMQQFDRERQIRQMKRVEKESLTLLMAKCFTQQAKKLKNQFRNYHFLSQSQKEFILGVPLAICVQYYGVVALVKASFPPTALPIAFSRTTEEVLENLQLKTRVKNSKLKEGPTKIYDLTHAYGSVHKVPRLYVDDLEHYLPNNPQADFDCLLRPQYVVSEERRLLQREKLKNLQYKLKEFADYISEQPLIPMNYVDFKIAMHQKGLNMSYMAKLYPLLKNKELKKSVQTFLTAKIIKTQILLTLQKLKDEGKTDKGQQFVEQVIRAYLQGDSFEIWKENALHFRRQYNFSINSHEICPNYLLSSLMFMVHAEYDTAKINKEKKLLEERNIIGKEFVRKLKPKIKTYYRIQQPGQIINWAVENKQKIQEEIINKSRSIKFDLLNEDIKLQIYARIALHLSPNSRFRQINRIYSFVNFQPPTKQTQIITMQYLKWLQYENKIEEYKKSVEKNLQILDYWLGEDHPELCPLYDSLADYYESKNQQENSINFSKQSLTTMIRCGGTHSHLAGKRYEMLADRQVRAGQKIQAMENYQKSKANMETFLRIPPQYPIILMKIGSLHLNFGQVEDCINKSLQSLKAAEDHKVPDFALMRTYELLSRAYELNGDYEQLRDISQLCCKVFNKSRQKYVFDQMIRISITGAICNMNSRKRQKLQSFISMIKEKGVVYNPSESIEQLMNLSRQYVVMEKFMKYLFVVQKIENEIRIGKQIREEPHEFERLLELVISTVGIEYFEGIMYQNYVE